MKIDLITPLATCLSENPDPADHWLWCFLCDRFFHLSAVVEDATSTPRCPFADCYGYGFDFHLYYWDSAREPDDPRWPASAAELRHGMQAPDYEFFAQSRFEARVAAIMRAFESSPEHRDLKIRRCVYTRPFLKMMDDLCWDLTDTSDESFHRDVARELVRDLPVWARTAELSEVSRMLDELRALFAFAERTGCLAVAHEWRKLCADDCLADVFKHTMRTDRRLRAQRRPRSRSRRRSHEPRATRPT